MIKDHWLLGVGTNNFSKFSKQYGVGCWYAYAHNFVLQFWAENGLFGMIFGLSIIGSVIYRWLKSWKHYEYNWLLAGVISAIYFYVKEDNQKRKDIITVKILKAL